MNIFILFSEINLLTILLLSVSFDFTDFPIQTYILTKTKHNLFLI